MRLINSNRINIEALLKVLILLGFAAFFLMTIQIGSVKYYVHPRIVPYMKFAIAAMGLISLFLAGDILRPRRRKTNLIVYMIFIIPLTAAFVFPGRSIESASSYNFQISDNYSSDNEITTPDNKDTGLSLVGDTVIMDDENFVGWYDELFINQDKYIGKKIEVVGFVFRMEDFDKNHFVPARFMMACCAADAQPAGFLCRYEKASEFKDNTWVKVTGVIGQDIIRNQKMPVIIAESVEEVEKPENEYVYAF